MPDTARTVVITGASSGFGAAAVRAFADRGDRVWGTMRDADGRNAAKKADLEAYAPGIAIAEMDVTVTHPWPMALPPSWPTVRSTS
jgi:NAD(P)-dependent dehydrogenase (short-subunit alcohol dehydrogenase family)